MRNSAWMVLGVGLGLGLGLAATACVGGTFACTSDANCLDDSTLGVCQPDGWCSFEDPACDSMQRYGEHASADLAGTCVPVGGDSSSGSVDPPDPPDPSLSTTGAGDSSGDPPDDGTTSGAVPPPPPETTDGGGSSDDGIAESDSGTVEPGCSPVLFDDFEDGVVDPQWDSWTDEGAELVEGDRVILFSFVDQIGPGASTGIYSNDFFDFTDGYVRIELAYPPSGPGMRLHWQLVTPNECIVGAFIQDGLVVADGETEGLDETPWLQIRADGGIIHVEGSPDGSSWFPIVPPEPTMCDLREAQVVLFGDIVEPNPAGASAAVDTIEACAAGNL